MNLIETLATPLLLTVVLLAAPGTPHPQDFYHAEGGRIVDSHNHTVKIAGVSWWGMETDNFAPLGLDRRPMDDILSEIRRMGFNTVRIPFSNQALHGDSMPQNISYDWNPELKGLTPIEVLDKVVERARAHGLRVILDRHRPDAKQQSDLWYTSQHSEQEWIEDWKMLAARYRLNDTVIGFDLHNEPHGRATWGTGDATTDWRLAAERAGNAVLSVNPHLLILVEGVSEVDSGAGKDVVKDTYWWGGNLSAAGQYPVRLSHPAQLVYSAHDYPPSVADQAWFNAANYPNNLTGVWREHWGYLAEQNRVPVILGEFGSHYASQPDKQWMGKLVAYLAAHNVNAMYWSLNPESMDTGGLLESDWRTVDRVKLAALEPILPGYAAPHTGVDTALLEAPAVPVPATATQATASETTGGTTRTTRQVLPVRSAAARPVAYRPVAARRQKAAADMMLDIEPQHPLAGSGN
jgi:endoglucanase